MNFIEKLHILNMDPKSSGLQLASDKDKSNISVSKRRILYVAEKDYRANAVYFRTAENGTSVPQIFIYDNSNNQLTDEDKREIHKRIWSSEIVPLYYVFEKTQLLVINGKQKIAIKKDELENFENIITDRLDLLADIEKKYDAVKHPYKAYFFDNDSFWDTEIYNKKFITRDNPFNLLINYLKELKKKIDKQVSEKILNRMIVQCILVKYLEEKRDENGNNIFTVKSNILRDKWRAETFVDIIKQGNLLDLFDFLSKYYNGKIFEWHKVEDAEGRQELSSLSKNVLKNLAAYFDGHTNIITGQIALWRYYSFQYLPVELISRIYEEFLPNKPGVVYTPPFLVDFLIDECMPIEDYKKFKNRTFKILDPSVGSGIFCVSAYKRLIDWYKINRYENEKKSWHEPIESEVLINILRDNIFGTDVEKEAVRIAIFSLTLALLENLTPLQILEELQFYDFSKENIFNDNFFNFFNKNRGNPDFNLVIGNPPFNPPERIRNSKYLEKLKKDYKIEVTHKIPDDNLALVFLDCATLLSKPNGEGLTCLILPSGPLLYGKWSMDYRTRLLQQFFVPQLIDFTHLRRILFNKDVPTVAIFVKNQKPDLREFIWHIIAARTKKEQNRLFFLFDHYDFHLISYQRALNERYIWKANLVGGGRLGRIVERLNSIKPTLGEYIKDKRRNGWKYSEGYIKGEIKDKAKEQIEKQFSKAEWLYEKPSIITKSFKEDGSHKIEINYDLEYFINTVKQNKDIFKPPHIIIHESIGTSNIPILYRKTGEELIFRHQFIGIHGDNNEELINIFDFIQNKFKELNRFFIYITSNRVLIDKETSILKTDIDNLPYPKDQTKMELSEIETVWRDDVLNYYIHQAKSPNSNPLNKKIKDIKKQLREYGAIFCQVMNASYSLKPECSFRQGKSFETPSYIATCFHYTDNNVKFSFDKTNEENFKEYFIKQTGRNQQITRIVKYYQGDTIWFIKPHQLRYWLKSIADRDAIDCFNDFLMNIEL